MPICWLARDNAFAADLLVVVHTNTAWQCSYIYSLAQYLLLLVDMVWWTTRNKKEREILSWFAACNHRTSIDGTPRTIKCPDKWPLMMSAALSQQRAANGTARHDTAAQSWMVVYVYKSSRRRLLLLWRLGGHWYGMQSLHAVKQMAVKQQATDAVRQPWSDPKKLTKNCKLNDSSRAESV